MAKKTKPKTRKKKKKIKFELNVDALAINAREAVRILGGDLSPPAWHQIVTNPRLARKKGSSIFR